MLWQTLFLTLHKLFVTHSQEAKSQDVIIHSQRKNRQKALYQEGNAHLPCI